MPKSSANEHAAGPDLKMRLLPHADDFLHIECSGDVGLSAFLSGKEPLAEWLGHDVYSRRVVLDFDKVDYLDSSGISWLIRLQKRFVTAKGLLVMHSIPPLVGEVIELLQLERVFNIQTDLAAAQAFLAGAKP